MIGGVEGDVLEEIRRDVGGKIEYLFSDGSPYLVFREGIVAVTRLGVTTTPDPLGTVTSKVRPGSIKNAMERLDAVQKQVLG